MKKLIVATLLGTIVYFLLQGLFFGLIFPNIYPQNPSTRELFLFLGSLFYVLMLATILLKWVRVSEVLLGLKYGAMVGFLGALSMDFFMYFAKPLHILYFVEEVLINTISAGVSGMIIVWISNKYQDV